MKAQSLSNQENYPQHKASLSFIKVHLHDKTCYRNISFQGPECSLLSLKFQLLRLRSLSVNDLSLRNK